MRKWVLSAGLSILWMCPAMAQTDAAKIFMAGTNWGRYIALKSTCHKLQLATTFSQAFKSLESLNPASFGAGRVQGDLEVEKVLSKYTDKSERVSQACTLAIVMYGSAGMAVANMVRFDPKAEAKEEAERKAKQKQRLQKAEQRKVEPAPADASNGDLLIAEDDERPDAMAGRRPMRLGTGASGRATQFGCVPCFNVFTYIAVVDGVPYVVNGASSPRWHRYRMVINGKSVPVRDGTTKGEISSGIISEIAAIPGCSMGSGDILSRQADAITKGACLGN